LTAVAELLTENKFCSKWTTKTSMGITWI